MDTCSTDSVKKTLDYVEDVNNFTKYEEFTVWTNVRLLLFDRKGGLKCLPLSVHVNNNSLEIIVNNISVVCVTMNTLI